MRDRAERWMVLLDLVTRHVYLDVLNSDAVDAYIDRTEAKYEGTLFGASRCPQMGRDLGDMHRAGLLRRHATGIGDNLCYQGFPKWVWSYRHTPRPSTEADVIRGAWMYKWSMKEANKQRKRNR